MEKLTPYILAALGVLMAVVGWLCREVIRMGKDLVELRTAFKIYIQLSGKGAATALDSPNPTPEPIRVLLRRYKAGTLTEGERLELVEFLKAFRKDPNEDKFEKDAATRLLSSMQADDYLGRKKSIWTSLFSSH